MRLGYEVLTLYQFIWDPDELRFTLIRTLVLNLREPT